MALDPSIILSSQPVNVLGALTAGQQAGNQMYQMGRERQFNDLLQTQGAGILAGDQGALNMLAGYDPTMALGIKQTQQSMAINMEELQLRRQQAKAQTEALLAQQSAQLTAGQLAAEKAKLNETLKGASFFYQRKDKAGYDAFLAQQGNDPAQFPFEMFPAHAAMGTGVLEAMETFAPPKPPEPSSTIGKLQADLAAGLITPDQYAMAAQSMAPSGMAITSTPDGGLTIQQGPGVQTKPFTEAQSKDNVYATRAVGALAALEPVADALASYAQQASEAVPFGLARGLQTDEFQKARQAGLEFLATILRKDTGAAVTPSEEEMYGRMFLPQPGDGAAVLEQKRIARARAVEAIKAGMSPAQILTVGAALDATSSATGAPQPSPVAPAAPPKRLRYNPATGELE